MREPRMRRGKPRPTSSQRSPGDQLTDREVEILWLLAEGLSNKLIADRLCISPHTVKFHVANTLSKMGTMSRTKAAVDFVLWHWREALKRVKPGSSRSEFAAYRDQVLAAWARDGEPELVPAGVVSEGGGCGR